MGTPALKMRLIDSPSLRKRRTRRRKRLSFEAPNVEIERAQKAHAHVDEASSQRRFLSSARMAGWAAEKSCGPQTHTHLACPNLATARQPGPASTHACRHLGTCSETPNASRWQRTKDTIASEPSQTTCPSRHPPCIHRPRPLRLRRTT
jgi:hypothetical protein